MTDTSIASPAFSAMPLCNRNSSPEDLFAGLVFIRAFEQSLLELFGRGVLAGTTHTCLGQESTAVGVIAALDRERDIVFSNHRGHGHFLAYCGEIEGLYLEIMGKPGGICAGRGGSQHLQFRNFYSNGVQGGIVPVATGMAMAEKLSGSGAIATVFLGDGTLGEGAIYEAMNFASLWSLPVLFVIDHNQYAQSTPTALQLAGSMIARFEAFGIAASECDSMNVVDVRRQACATVDAVRKESRPRGLVLKTYRLGPHSKGDDTRDPDEIKAAWKTCPVTVSRRALSEEVALAIEHAASEAVLRVRESALAAPGYEA